MTLEKCECHYLQGPRVRPSHFSMIQDIPDVLPGDQTQQQSAHTHKLTRTHAQPRHGGEWIRSEGQTPSHHDNNITASAVDLTSTSGPKPLLLAQTIASSLCDTLHFCCQENEEGNDSEITSFTNTHCTPYSMTARQCMRIR